jgi:hypothetical protein
MGKKGIHRGLLRALVACAASNAAASDEVSSLASELAAAKAELARFRAAHAASLEPGVRHKNGSRPRVLLSSYFLPSVLSLLFILFLKSYSKLVCLVCS